jgi:CubicO group peptidase (beta-lactamase class C family)
MHVPRSSATSIVLAALLLSACHRMTGGQSPEYGRTAPPSAAPTPSAIRDVLVRVLDRASADSAFPGAYAVVGNRERILAEYGVGRLDWKASPSPDAHTLWDLASLTKVVATTTLVMQLVERGMVDLDAPVRRYLPEWTGANKERVTVRHLLTHTSGLPAFKPYDQQTHDPDSLAKLMFATALDTVPGARMVYSDIGAYMLGRLVERLCGQPLDACAQARVFAPLGMTETTFRPPVTLLARIAPTEFDSLRGGLVRGKVHDERAYYLGGVSAHAGLFGSAHDLARFARMYLNGGTLDGARILTPATIRTFTTLQVSNRALGWQKPDGSNSAGHAMSADAFGHTGFTGTSIWMDPQRDIFIILLSNRVNPTRANTRINQVRVALADAVMSAITPTTGQKP